MRRLIAPICLALTLAVPVLALPGRAKDAIDLASAALRRGDGIAAEVELNRALQAGADRALVAAAMGEAQLILGNRDKAREWLRPGEFAEGQQAYGWRMLGLLERREGRFVAAGQAYDQALRFAPEDPQLWVDIGRLRYVGGEHFQAIDASMRAVEFGPKNPQALEFRAEIARDSSGWESALPFYARAIEAKPNDLGLLGGYAVSLGEAGRTREMLEVCRRMLAMAPRHPLPWHLQAVMAARAGNADLARTMLNRIGDGDRRSSASLLLSGVLELEEGNPELAILPLEELVRRQPANQRAQLLLARAYASAGAADQLLQKFIAQGRRPDAPVYLLTLLGRALEEQGDRAGAAEFLDRAALAAPLPLSGIAPNGSAPMDQSDPYGAIQQVRDGFARNDFIGAAIVADRFVAQRPGAVEARGLAGDAQLGLGNYAGALEHYHHALRVRFPELLLMRINDAYARAGKASEGLALTSGYLQAYPRSLLASRMAADYAMHSGDWERTRDLLEGVRARGVNRDARLLADLSIAYVRTQNGRTALIAAQRAWHLQPQNVAAVQAYALALADDGSNPTLARQIAAQAKRLGADRKLLAEIGAKLKAR